MPIDPSQQRERVPAVSADADVAASVLGRLARQPRLDAGSAAAAIACKVCGRPAPFFDVVDINKCAVFYPFGPSGVTVSYYRCDACGRAASHLPCAEVVRAEAWADLVSQTGASTCALKYRDRQPPMARQVPLEPRPDPLLPA
jgi:hypothetical protein